MTEQQADRIFVTYYTDPLCCWSWGMEPQLRKFRYQYRHLISFRYCMAGLIPEWEDRSGARVRTWRYRKVP